MRATGIAGKTIYEVVVGAQISISGETMGDTRRHRFLAEKVYNDLTDLMNLLDTLDIINEVNMRLTHVGGVSWNFTIQLVAASFTRRANESQYEI
jgi:hypothetical protein